MKKINQYIKESILDNEDDIISSDSFMDEELLSYFEDLLCMKNKINMSIKDHVKIVNKKIYIDLSNPMTGWAFLKSKLFTDIDMKQIPKGYSLEEVNNVHFSTFDQTSKPQDTSKIDIKSINKFDVEYLVHTKNASTKNTSLYINRFNPKQIDDFCINVINHSYSDYSSDIISDIANLYPKTKYINFILNYKTIYKYPLITLPENSLYKLLGMHTIKNLNTENFILQIDYRVDYKLINQLNIEDFLAKNNIKNFYICDSLRKNFYLYTKKRGDKYQFKKSPSPIKSY